MKKVLIFGTGKAAERFVENAGTVFRVVGFADNDARKHGKRFHGLPVHAPPDIPNLAFDEIIIASMWYADIHDQLVQKIGVDEQRIRPIPKVFSSAGKRYRPFEDEDTRNYAARVLQHVCPFLEQRGIACYVDHGTLIGLVREDRIMPWDDDIDLSVAYTDRQRLYDCVAELVATMPDNERMHWKTDLIYNNIDEVIALFFTVEDPVGDRHPFNAGISFFVFESGLATEAINWAPAYHYAGGEWIDTSLGRFRAPNDYKAYLTLHYGEWQTPVRDMSFGQIDNFKKREAPAQWIEWDPRQTPSPEPLITATAQSLIQGSFLYVPLALPNSPHHSVEFEQQEASLQLLAQHLHVERLYLSGCDPTEDKNWDDIFTRVSRTGIANTIAIEIGLNDDPSKALQAAIEKHGFLRAFHKEASSRRVDPPIFETDFCTRSMEDAIRFFRCRYKKYWMLWNNLIARCPKTLHDYLHGNKQEPTADIMKLDRQDAHFRESLIHFVRHRPCDACHGCPSNDTVWQPFTRYAFAESLPVPE